MSGIVVTILGTHMARSMARSNVGVPSMQTLLEWQGWHSLAARLLEDLGSPPQHLGKTGLALLPRRR